MPIDRTAFNALVDDDGTNLVGTLIDKAKIEEVLLDPIDAAIAGGGGSALTEQTTTATGAQHNVDLTTRLTYLRCTGAAPVFSGFTVASAAPQAGDRVLIHCLGTTAKVTHQDTGSTDVHRIITPSVNGQIVGVNGLMLLIYDGTTDRWREVLMDPGAPIAHPFNAADYTASGAMTWTLVSGDAAVDTYVQRGRFLTLNSTLDTTTVGGTPSSALIKALPGGFTADLTLLTPVIPGYDNLVLTSVYCSVAAAAAVLQIRRLAGGNWAASTNQTYIYLTNLTIGVN